MARADTNPAGMAPLQRLILDRMREKRWEPKHVEARGVKHATLHRYMNPIQLLQLPRRSVLEDLAHGLQLPVEEVTQAAKDSVGWDSTKDLAWRNSRPDVEVDQHPVGYDLNAELDGLSEDEVESVLAVVRAMKRAKGR